MKKEKGDTSFFKQFETKQMRIDDFVPQPKEFIPEPEVKPDAWVADVGEKPTEEEKKSIEEPKVLEVEDDLLFEQEVKYEPKKGWEPELYNRVKPQEKELGRYETELLEQEKKRKLESFLAKAGEIEQEVDKLNTK